MKSGRSEELHAVAIGRINRAHRLLLERFASPFRETYIRGKTELRDFLYEKMGCSVLEAEMLVDALEKTGKIEFERSRKGMRYGTWGIRPKG